MKRIISHFLLTVLAGVSVSAAQNPAPVPLSEETATIEGVVVQAGTNTPIANAELNAAWISPLRMATRVGEATSDAEGRFFLKGLAPGSYIIFVTRAGYAAEQATAVLQPGQKSVNVRVELLRPAAIAGKILDEDGRARSGIEVLALAYANYDGRPLLEERATAETDDRGEYRLMELEPGTYYIAARREDYGGGRLDVTYYPGIEDRRSATKVSVAAGAEVQLGDYALRRQPTFKITARVLLPPGWSGEKPGGTSFLLVPRTRVVTQRWTMFQFNGPDAQGAFATWSGVPPDTYDIYVRLRRDRTAEGLPDEDTAIYGRATVDVFDKDADAGMIVLESGAPISGRITSKQSFPPDFQMSRLSLSLRELDGSTISRQSSVAEDGTFVFLNVPKGRFRITMAGLSPDFHAESVRHNAREAIDSGMTVDTDQPGVVQISLASGAATVQGSVRTPLGEPVPEAAVVLVPPRDRRGIPENFHLSRADATGNFCFPGLRPGDYTVLAFASAPPDALDPEFLAQFENQGARVTVRSSDAQTVTARVIPR